MSLFRVYEAHECGEDGYPYAWHRVPGDYFRTTSFGIKDVVRTQAGNRCVRCGHPYMKGMGEWSVCGEECDHGGEHRGRLPDGSWVSFNSYLELDEIEAQLAKGHVGRIEARWRILTVHHLNNVKADCRWWNLAALCQRCHLTIQGKVKMDRPYDQPHSAWFIPYVCGFYASKYLGEEIEREEALARQEELLMLELRQEPLFT